VAKFIFSTMNKVLLDNVSSKKLFIHPKKCFKDAKGTLASFANNIIDFYYLNHGHY